MLPADYTQDNQPKFQQQQQVDSSEPPLSSQINIELDNLEELILEGTRIPLTELAILNEYLLLDQLDQIKANLPTELNEAIKVLTCRQEIITEAEEYAYSIIKSAQERAVQMMQESTIMRQAELDGAKTRLKTEQECEQLKQTTQKEIEQWRQDAIAECQAIQLGADKYADSVLGDIEEKLQTMLAVIQNGRQQLNQ